MVVSSLVAAKRLRKELQVLRRDVDETICLQHHPDNLLCWKAWIRGPADTPYAGGVFQLDIRCGVDYPLAPPTIKFVTKVRFIYMYTYAVVLYIAQLVCVSTHLTGLGCSGENVKAKIVVSTHTHRSP
jgi:ubiquitin-protein ligase